MNLLKKHLYCRRTFIALVAMGVLTFLGYRGAEVAEAIAAVAIGLAASNAYQARGHRAPNSVDPRSADSAPPVGE